MADDILYSEYKRKLEPDLFPEQIQPKGPVSKPASVNFLFGPRQPQSRPRVKIGKNDPDWNSRLQWARFVDDARILKSNDREKLKKYLDELLKGLAQRYTHESSRAFPGNFELTRLTQVVTALARTLGIKKAGFGDLLGAMRRIENRWNKMPLIAFVDDLLNRLLMLPLCPLSVVHQAYTKYTKHQGILNEIKSFLSGVLEPDVDKTPWAKWFEMIQALNFPTSSLASSSDTKALRSEFSRGNATQKQLLAYLAFMDLKRQQLEWNNKYGERIAASLQWIYLLQRSSDYQRLTQVFCGSAPSPEVVGQILEKLGNRERRNLSYNKHKTPTRKTKREARK